ncbi:MAG: NAD-dependent epimerase/dehydratase family protein [Sphingobacteriales bacterium]|nr:MAG: NAD-dependent epimerase/dehydratase family protein [Sphingobacteriales bacterium]
MILVTGGTGLVGSHLLFQLARRKVPVIAIKRNTADECLVKNVFYHQPQLYKYIQWKDADILDISSLQTVLRGAHYVYHCAGKVSYVPGDAARMNTINVRGTENIVRTCFETGVKKLCYVSSVSAINRVNENEIITEDTPWRISKENSNYAISKYEAEKMVWMGIKNGLNAVIVNPTIIIGSGKWNNGSAAMFNQVWKGLKFYPAGTAGFVDVRDVCTAMILLMESGIHSERFIINSENLSYKQVFETIAVHLGKPKPILRANYFLLETAWRVAALKKYLTGETPFITKETVISGRKKMQFSNEKIRQATQINFTPVEQSIKNTCDEFLRQHR